MLKYGTTTKSNGSVRRTQEQKATRKKKKDLQATALSVLVSTGGIGRELYTAPFIWIPAEMLKLTDAKGKTTTYDKFYVEAIEITNKQITGLAIRNNRNERVYVYSTKKAKEDATK